MLTLIRNQCSFQGIFGELKDQSDLIAVTLEHAYSEEGSFRPKIPPGNYICVRGVHRLDGMKNDFLTFEITGVQGHSNLLFHWGNWNSDSAGCVLLGETITKLSSGQMITNSRLTFEKFIESYGKLTNFTLTVLSPF
jgi:hypothetical protein